MDLAKTKKAIAGMLSTLFVLDSQGIPTLQHVRANAEAPMSLADTDLPTWIIFTGAAQYFRDRSVDRLSKEVRDFHLCLYVIQSQAGLDGEAERRVEPYLDYSRNLIQQHPLFYDGVIGDIVPGIQEAYLIKDDGIVILPFNNQKYDGLRFTVRVEGYNRVIYGNE